MARRARIPWVTLAALLAAIPAGAQWPLHDTPGVPRTADGEVDWSAATPRLLNGKPDFSGLWRAGVADGRGPDLSDGRYLFRAGSYLIAASLPYTAHGEALKNRRETRDGGDNPRAHCRPIGIAQMHTTALPAKYIHTPGLLLMMYEGNREWRQVFTDGRPLPPRGVKPQTNGYSVGRWDGDALVVETTGFRDDGWLDTVGSPLTDEGKIIERFRRPWYGRMEIEFTIDDPKVYRKPFTVGVMQYPMLNQQLIESVCRENNRYSQRFPAAGGDAR